MFRTIQMASLLLAAVVLLAIGCTKEKKDAPSDTSSTTSSNTPSNDSSHSAIAQDEAPGPEETYTTSPNLKATNEADAHGLRNLFTRLQDAIRANETATVVEITRGFFPDDASFEKAIKDSDEISRIRAMHAEFSNVPDDQIAKMFSTDPARTEILVHSATTEEIADGSFAFNEFPDGAKAAAHTVLQPGMTFYAVELVEPGKREGMKYHMFYHDGQNWKMLGPIWRPIGE